MSRPRDDRPARLGRHWSLPEVAVAAMRSAAACNFAPQPLDQTSFTAIFSHSGGVCTGSALQTSDLLSLARARAPLQQPQPVDLAGDEADDSALRCSCPVSWSPPVGGRCGSWLTFPAFGRREETRARSRTPPGPKIDSVPRRRHSTLHMPTPRAPSLFLGLPAFLEASSAGSARRFFRWLVGVKRRVCQA